MCPSKNSNHGEDGSEDEDGNQPSNNQMNRENDSLNEQHLKLYLDNTFKVSYYNNA